MVTVKVAVTLEDRLLRALDREVANGSFPNRSQAVGAAVELLLKQKEGLLAALTDLDPEEEKRLAEEWLEGERW